jgi:hypothetical protein
LQTHLAKRILLFGAEHLHFSFEERYVLQPTAHIRAGCRAHAFETPDYKKCDHDLRAFISLSKQHTHASCCRRHQ